MPRFETGDHSFLEFSIVEPAPTPGVSPSSVVNILMVHGYYGASWIWETYPDLLQTRSRCIMVDLYSHGKSSDVPVALAKDEDLENARDIIALMHSDHFPKNNKYYVVGVSFGGRVGGLIAAQDPEHVLGAVLLVPVPVKGNPLAVAQAEAVAAAASDFDVFAQSMTAISAAPPSRTLRPLRPDLFKRLFPDYKRAAKANSLERTVSMAADRSSIIFEGLHAPLIFITGDSDFFFPMTMQELSLFKNTVPHVHCFYNRGHLLSNDGTTPVEIAKVIDSFIADYRPHQ